MHVIAAKAVAFKEALEPGFKDYQQQVVLKRPRHGRGVHGARLRRGLRRHRRPPVPGQLHRQGPDRQGRGRLALGAANITVNKNAVPNDPQSPFVTSGIRVGTPAITTRGFGEDEARELAGWMCDVIDARGDAGTIEQVKAQVLALCRAAEKRPISTEQIDAALSHINRKLLGSGEREVSSRRIGELVMEELRELDQVAYVRFASVYRKFEDVAAFREEIERLERQPSAAEKKAQLDLLADLEPVPPAPRKP
jgi:transcriptional regulator NrdR